MKTLTLIEILGSKFFDWEFDVVPWMLDNYYVFLVPAILYPFLINIREFTNIKRTYNLPRTLFLWNTFQCIFSTVATYKVGKPFLYKLFKYGYHESVCLTRKDISYQFQPWGKWIFLFMLSKIVDLGDTLFMVIKGKPVNFLHWYHHLYTLIAVYIQSLTMVETTEWIAITNYAIHSWMYGHYALATIVPSIRGNRILTILQIMQMLHAFVLSNYHAMYCNSIIDITSITMSVVYTVLFVSFYTKKYNRSNSISIENKEE